MNSHQLIRSYAVQDVQGGGRFKRVTSVAKRTVLPKYNVPVPPEGHYVTREREECDRRTTALLSLMRQVRRLK